VLESDFSVLGMLLPIDTPSTRRRNAAFDRLLELIDAEVRTRLHASEPQADFLQFAIDDMRARDLLGSPEQLRWLSLRVLGAVFAAHTNTAMSTAACLLDLLEHPDALAQVRAEIATLAPDTTLDLAALRKLVWLHRCVNETLRLRSTGGIWRKAMHELELGDHQVPAGSLIGCCMGLVNLDPQRYAEPEVYRPDRYAAFAADSYQSPPVGSTPLQFGAFGTGRNLCSGRPLAYTMLALVLVVLLRDYEWTLITKPRRWFRLMTAGVARPIGPLRLGYRRR
jgi:sterol 14-demethylase